MFHDLYWTWKDDRAWRRNIVYKVKKQRKAELCLQNTNMHIERIHRTVKYIHLHGKNVKGLDSFSDVFCPRQLFDILISLSKGKLTTKLKDFRKSHKCLREIDTNLIIRDKQWVERNRLLA